MDESTYDAPIYNPKAVVQTVGTMLRTPRGYYSTNFTDIFSSDSDVQHDYVHGLLLICWFFVAVFVTWSLVLVVLKLKGKEVGCASGRPFLSQRVDDDLFLGSTDNSESMSSLGSGTPTGSHSDGESSLDRHIQIQTPHSQGSFDSFDKHFEGASRGESSYDSHPEEQLHTTQVTLKTNKREQRTRLCFLFFGVLSLVCVPLVLVYSFGPIKEAAGSFDENLLAARDTVNQVTSSLNSIESATVNAKAIIGSTPLDIAVLCPNIAQEDIATRLGVDLNVLVEGVSDEFNGVADVANHHLAKVRRVINGVSSGMDEFENARDETESWLWIVPGVLFAVSITTAVSMLGVLVAWKEKSGPRAQLVLSNLVLPLLMLTSLACWGIVIFAAFGTMLGSDMCTTSTSQGSPDETIQQALSVLNMNVNSTRYKFISAYTNGCMGADPTTEIDAVETLVQDNIDIVWRQISKVDSVGRTKILEECGGDKLSSMLTNSREFAKLLTTIRKSLDSASTSLECPRINPIYTATAHDMMCTNVTSAFACGLIVFLVLALSTMTMISLRSSWLRNTEEEKVYHDDDDVAENMILDEHEEYLAYISRYKHEWQEYQGFEEGSVAHSMGEGSYSTGSGGSAYYDDGLGDSVGQSNGSGTCSDAGSDITPTKQQKSTHQPTRVARSVDQRAEPKDNVSFASLKDDASKASVSSIGEDDLFKVPTQIVAPPPENPRYSDTIAATQDSSVNEDGAPTARPNRVNSILERFGIVDSKDQSESKSGSANDNESTGHGAGRKAGGEATASTKNRGRQINDFLERIGFVDSKESQQSAGKAEDKDDADVILLPEGGEEDRSAVASSAVSGRGNKINTFLEKMGIVDSDDHEKQVSSAIIEDVRSAPANSAAETATDQSEGKASAREAILPARRYGLAGESARRRGGPSFPRHRTTINTGNADSAAVEVKLRSPIVCQGPKALDFAEC